MQSADLLQYDCVAKMLGICIHTPNITMPRSNLGDWVGVQDFAHGSLVQAGSGDAPDVEIMANFEYCRKADIHGFTANLTRQGYVLVHGKVTVRADAAEGRDLIVLASIVNSDWSFFDTIPIPADDTENFEFTYNVNVAPRGSSRGIALLVAVADTRETEGVLPMFFVAQKPPNEAQCTESLLSEYIDAEDPVFHSECFPQGIDTVPGGYVNVEVQRNAGGDVTGSFVTKMPLISTFYNTSFDPAKQDLAMMVAGGLAMAVYVMALLIDIVAPTSRKDGRGEYKSLPTDVDGFRV